MSLDDSIAMTAYRRFINEHGLALALTLLWTAFILNLLVWG